MLTLRGWDGDVSGQSEPFGEPLDRSVVAARAAAQLHEAAQNVARIAARRSARAERQTTEPVAGQRLELTREWEETYPARPRHVRDARDVVEGFLSGCGADDEALLICSELTTNSVLHSRSKDGGKFILRVTVNAEYIWIECEDAGGPWLARAGDGRSHGLEVVHALCGEGGWGVEDLDGGRTGRVVWARRELERSGT